MWQESEIIIEKTILKGGTKREKEGGSGRRGERKREKEIEREKANNEKDSILK